MRPRERKGHLLSWHPAEARWGRTKQGSGREWDGGAAPAWVLLLLPWHLPRHGEPRLQS